MSLVTFVIITDKMRHAVPLQQQSFLFLTCAVIINIIISFNNLCTMA